MENLLCVKSILTIVLCLGFVALTFLHPDEYAETMKTVVTTVITFYFTHQINKNENKKRGDNVKNETNGTF